MHNLNISMSIFIIINTDTLVLITASPNISLHLFFALFHFETDSLRVTQAGLKPMDLPLTLECWDEL